MNSDPTWVMQMKIRVKSGSTALYLKEWTFGTSHVNSIVDQILKRSIFFVNFNPTLEAAIAEEVTGLDPNVSQPDSMTQFLQLSTFSPCANSRRYNSLVDFAKSIILTSLVQ